MKPGFNIDMSLVKNKKIFLTLSILLTIAAIGVHAYLTNHYYGIKLGALDSNSLCNVNALFNCDTVTASRFSALFGIPMALWGALTNFVMLLMLLILRYNLSENHQRTANYTVLLSGFMAIVSVIMGTISLAALSSFCLFCMITYFISFAVLGLLLGYNQGLKKGVVEDLKALLSTHKSYLFLLAVIPAFSYIVHTMALDSRGLGELKKLAAEKVAYWQLAPAQNFDLSKGLVYQKSSQEPTITIVEFADFRCPHCKHAYPSLHAFAESHPDVKLVFKPFPLDGVCNSAITGGDGVSCKLSYATFCAEKLANKGWDAHNYIFDHQEQIVRSANLTEDLQKMSNKINISFDELKVCLEDPAIHTLVKEMAQEGATAQIRGTPAIFVNNKLLNGGQVLPILEAAYQSAREQ